MFIRGQLGYIAKRIFFKYSGLFSTPSSFSPLFNDLPPEIARLVKGSFGFPVTILRREFERKSAEQDLRIAARDYSRLEQKDLLEKRGIIRDQNKLEREISAPPGEESQRRLAALRQAVSNQQQGCCEKNHSVEKLTVFCLEGCFHKKCQ